MKTRLFRILGTGEGSKAVKGQHLITAILMMTFSFQGLAHEHTRRDHDASLDPNEEFGVVKSQAETQSDNKQSSDLDRFASLTIRLKDAKTGQPIPGLIRITLSNGEIFAPLGLLSRGTMLAKDHPAKDWFTVTQPTTIKAPRDRFTVEAISGLETEQTRRTVDLTHTDEATIELSLVRFHNARNLGWHNGNTHLHLNHMTREEADEYLRTISRSDGLELVFVSHLERVEADKEYISNTYTSSDLDRLGGSGVLFGNGEEHRHNFGPWDEGYGHVMFLDIRKLIQPVSVGPGITGEGFDSPPLRRGIEQARRDDATVIWCHNKFGLEDVPNWIAGLIQANNIFDGGSHGSYEDSFYRFLNIGLHVPFSTGTDWFIYDFSRAYVKLEGPVTVRGWLSRLRAGRSFISNGPLLEFEADEKSIGDTITLEEASHISVSGRAVGRSDFERVQLVYNGKVIHSVRSRPVNAHHEANLQFTFLPMEPGWIALRTAGAGTNEMGETLFSHTSPIYIEIGGETIFNRDVGAELIKEMEESIATVRAKGKFEQSQQRDEVLQLYREGIETLRKRLED